MGKIKLFLLFIFLLSGCDLDYDSAPKNIELLRRRIKETTGMTDQDINKKIKEDQEKALNKLCEEKNKKE